MSSLGYWWAFDVLGDLIKRAIEFLGKALPAPRFMLESAKAATLSVLATFLDAARSGLVEDVNRLKQAGLERVEALTDSEQAKAQLEHAKVIDAENTAVLKKREAAIKLAEAEKMRAEAAKTQAEADAIRTELEIKRTKAATEAQIKLLAALQNIRDKGGAVYLDTDLLQRSVLQQAFNAPSAAGFLAGNLDEQDPPEDDDSQKPKRRPKK